MAGMGGTVPFTGPSSVQTDDVVQKGYRWEDVFW